MSAKKRTCSIEGCTSPVRTRGWCHIHYKRWWRHGDPLVVLTSTGQPPHGHGTSNGGKPSPTYISWNGMRKRCYESGHISYKNYGARGISVCERWRGPGGFKAFLADMGERPPGTSLERIDVNGNYEPGNTRWATSKEQARNKRRAA